MSSSSRGLESRGTKNKGGKKEPHRYAMETWLCPYLPRFFLVAHYLLANSLQELAHPPVYELLWTIFAFGPWGPDRNAFDLQRDACQTFVVQTFPIISS